MSQKIIRSVLIAVFIAITFTAVHVYAATLGVTPSGGTESVGKTFSVRVVVDSGGQSINAVSGAVNFSNSTLTLDSISKSGIVTLWAQDPTYSNSAGTASFQGVILNGYSGSGGTVVTLTFTAKAQGTGTISLDSNNSSVLLNDGQGTNALSSTSGASFTINQAATPPPTTTTSSHPTTTSTTTSATPATTSTMTVPVASTGAKPLFTAYQTPLLPGNFVVVKGTADQNSLVNMAFTQVSHDGTTTVTEVSLPTDANGDFTFVSDQKVSRGYTYTLIATTPSGQSTPALQLAVKNGFWFNLAMFIASIIAIQMSVALAILLMLLISGYLLYRNYLLKKRIRQLER